ncbi:MAG: hypothetical protein JW829_08590, partial [Pirellulales bacterium]|nr:hypothetical protein [Pirellulales bacterium]
MNLWIRSLAGLVFCAGICSSMITQPLAASSGSVTTLPAPTSPKSPNGLTIAVDSRWVDGYGYRPIRVTIAAAKPAVENRTITMRLKAGSWREKPFISVDQDIELPAGATAASAIIAVPRDQPWDMLWWDLLVDGLFDSTLSLDHFQNRTLQQINRLWQNEGRPLILFVGKTPLGTTPALPISVNLPAAETLPPGSFSIGENSVTVDGRTITIDNMYNSGAGLNMAMCSPVELPTRWIDYTALDAVAISVDDLIRLKKDQFPSLAAILDWTRTGGTLWIYGSGDEQQNFKALESALGLESGRGNGMAGGGHNQSWRKLQSTRSLENPAPYPGMMTDDAT